MLFDYNNPRRIVFKTKQASPVFGSARFAGLTPSRAFGCRLDGLNLRNPAPNDTLLVNILNNCPECGGYLVRRGYCFSCINCGWGACGG